MFEVGPCESAYKMGFLIGERFSDTIKGRLDTDLVLRDQLLPFAQSPQSQPLIEALCNNNKTRFPTYWDELVGIAAGSGVPILVFCSVCDVFVENQYADYSNQLQEGDSSISSEGSTFSS